MVFFARSCKFVGAIAATAVLARLLSPADFGLIAMVLAVTGFVTRFRDLGLAMPTVQRAEITHEQVSTLFWVNVAFGLAIMLLTAAAAPLVAWFYDEPRLTTVTIVLAVAFLFGGLTVQHQALVRRQMRFARLAAIQVLAAVVTPAVGIGLALLGAGYWALVAMELVLVATVAVGVWVVCRWRPGRPVRGAGIRGMLAFGGHLTGANILDYVARNIDKVLLGWRWGAAPLGLYSKAYQLLLLPVRQINQPISTVAVPALSRLQNEPERYRAYYRQGIQLIAVLGMPLVFFTFVAADEIILTILGSQWAAAAVLFRLLAPAALLNSLNVATSWVYLSLGQVARQFRWTLLSSAAAVVAFLVGLRWGAEGVAVAYSVSFCALRIPEIPYCFSRSPLRSADLLGVLWRPTVASVFAGAAVAGLKLLVATEANQGLLLLGDLVTFAAAYLLAWHVLPGGRRIVRDMIRLVGDLRAARWATDRPDLDRTPGGEIADEGLLEQIP